ncbi:MAG: threonine synthase [Thermoprotei archaeon]|nr:MAG: threonine synthase [Thermoprotei archaeon]
MNCGEVFPPNAVLYTCPRCGSLLEVRYELRVGVSWSIFRSRPFTMWRYRELIPVDTRYVVSLGEGGTPLYRAEKLARWVGVKRLYLKFEGANPTGSFKDRGVCVGIAKALECGARVVACASTGNTAASVAAYSARAGVKCVLFLPEGKVAPGKLFQALLHGATVIELNCNFDEALRLVLKLCGRGCMYLLNSVNPWRLEGQKSIAYEIADVIGVPDYVVVPVGNGGNISAIWKGFRELHDLGLVGELPRMIAAQATGAAPIVKAFRAGKVTVDPVNEPETIATAIRIGNPVNAPKALKALYESRGLAEAVSDYEILEAQVAIARYEGIGVEPASATSVAVLRKLVHEGVLEPDATYVCVLTGHALKDPSVVDYLSKWVERYRCGVGDIHYILETVLRK